MDLSTDQETLSTPNVFGGMEIPQEQSLSNTCQTETGGTILLQLLEFKTHLVEVVEELHIRRDADICFQDEMSKVVSEKQEVEWEKESLQHQTEMAAKKYTESLTNIKNQLQAKIRNIEEEKGKYQVIAELKDKEITNLKEELKLLQLLKYNLERKSSELEQKLTLQSRSKDSHLNQIGKVEKRFSELSGQCAMVKQAQEALEQNADEAMRINKKLTSVNRKQEETILSLKKQLEEVNNQLIKVKMSSVRHNKNPCPSHQEQNSQLLHRKLIMESKMNKRLMDETEAARGEKQEVMKALQHSQQLLLNQTQTLRRLQLQLQKQEQHYQALKQEHEVMREKSIAMEDKVIQLMASHTSAKSVWDKEKTKFYNCIKSEQQDHHAVKKAYIELQQKYKDVSAQLKMQMQQSCELKLSLTLVEQTGGVRPPNEPIPSSMLPSTGSLKNSTVFQTKNPDGLEDMRAETQIVAAGVIRGEEAHIQNQSIESSSNLFTSKETLDNVGYVLKMDNLTTSEKNTNVVSDLICTTSLICCDELPSKDYPVSELSPGHRLSNCSVDLLTKENNHSEVDKEINMTVPVVKQENNNRGEEDVRSTNEQVKATDLTEGVSAEINRSTLITPTNDSVDIEVSSRGSTKAPKLESKDSTKGKSRNEEEERAKTDTEPQTHMTVDKRGNTTQVADFMDNSESPLAEFEPCDCSRTFSMQDIKKDKESSLENKRCEVFGEENLLSCDESQSNDPEPNSAIQVVQYLLETGNQTYAESSNCSPTAVGQGLGNKSKYTLSDKSSTNFPAELSSTSLFNAAQSCGADNIQHFHTETEPNKPFDCVSNMTFADDSGNTGIREECVQMMVKSQTILQNQETSGQEQGRESDAQKNCKSPTYVTSLDQKGISTLKDVCTDITMDECNSNSETDICDVLKQDICNDREDATGMSMPLYQSSSKKALLKTNCSECYELPLSQEISLDDTDDLYIPRKKIYRSSFDWSTPMRQTVKSATASIPVLHHFVEQSSVCEQLTSGSDGSLGHSSSTVFTNSRLHKVPLVITRASNLLKAPSDCITVTTVRKQPGEWKPIGQMTADVNYRGIFKESRDSGSIIFCPVSTSPSTASTHSWQTTSGVSGLSTPTSGLECDAEPSSTLDTDELQSSFRAQISRIEEFLKRESLCLPPKKCTDN